MLNVVSGALWHPAADTFPGSCRPKSVRPIDQVNKPLSIHRVSSLAVVLRFLETVTSGDRMYNETSFATGQLM